MISAISVSSMSAAATIATNEITPTPPQYAASAVSAPARSFRPLYFASVRTLPATAPIDAPIACAQQQQQQQQLQQIPATIGAPSKRSGRCRSTTSVSGRFSPSTTDESRRSETLSTSAVRGRFEGRGVERPSAIVRRSTRA